MTKSVKYTEHIRRAALALLITVGAAGVSITSSTPTLANHDYYSSMGRQASKSIYGAVGTRVCGSRCGKAGRYIGGKAFGAGERVRDYVGNGGRRIGRGLRNRYDNYRSRSRPYKRRRTRPGRRYRRR